MYVTYVITYISHHIKPYEKLIRKDVTIITENAQIIVLLQKRLPMIYFVMSDLFSKNSFVE